MANKKMKKIIVQAAGFVLMVATLMGGIAFSAPTSVAHAVDETLLEPSWAEGAKYSWGVASWITDPVKVTVENKGVYYDPTSYVYFGSVYNAATGEYLPVLNRVLDREYDNTGDPNDADNRGEDGAMFLLTEEAMEAKAWYWKYWASYWAMDSDYAELNYENIYNVTNLNSIASMGGTNAIFGNDRITSGADYDYLRPITKTDREESMEGMFASCGKSDCIGNGCLNCFGPGSPEFYFETDKAYFQAYGTAEDSGRWCPYSVNFIDLIGLNTHPNFLESYGHVVRSTEAELLKESKYFLLSIEEVNNYVGNFRGEALATTNLYGEEVTWYTRTGLGENYDRTDHGVGGYNYGNHVAGIDAAGNVIPVSVDDASAYTRYGFNIEHDEVVYTQQLTDKISRLAFRHPDFNHGREGDTGSLFTADIVGVKNGEAILSYKNPVRQTMRNGFTAYVTVVIERDNAILHYANVCEESEFSSAEKVVKFKLPEGYTYDADDTFKVFWEYKPIDEKGISYISNIVDVGCVHPYTNTPTCSTGVVCTENCVEAKTEYYDKDNHERLTEWLCEEDEQSGTMYHYKNCDACQKTKISKAPCNIEFTNCVGTCTVCGHTTADYSRCNYDENGICTYGHGHYEPPTYVTQGTDLWVYIENIGQWNYHATLVNEARLIGNPVDGYTFSPGRYSVIRLENDLNFEGHTFVPMGMYRDENTNSYVRGEVLANTGVTISGINYTNVDADGVGIFGYARNLTVHNLTVTDCSLQGRSGVGVIGMGTDVSVDRVDVTDSSFVGNDCVGAIIGKVYVPTVGTTNDSSIRQTWVRLLEVWDNSSSTPTLTAIKKVLVSATDTQSVGAFIGKVEEGTAVSIGGGCLSMGVTSLASDATSDGYESFFSGHDLPFAPASLIENELVTVDTDSHCLYATDSAAALWDGTASRATFAGGKVAHTLRKYGGGWSQIVDKTEYDSDMNRYEPLPTEPLPRYIPAGEDGRRTEKLYPVYHVTYCNGISAAKYTNNASRDYQVHKPENVLEWKWTYGSVCEAFVHCELCGTDIWMDAHVEMDYSRVPVRADYTATLLDPHGEPYKDADGVVFATQNMVIGRPIESMIGMTKMVVDFDGIGVSPEELMNNHRLNDGSAVAGYREYEVFFLDESGNKLTTIIYDYYGKAQESPDVAKNVGTYDLLVIGKNDYEGQEYTFEDVLTINPVVVEIEPKDVWKYHDGTASFEPSYRILDEELAEQFYNNWEGEHFAVRLENAPSAAEGAYSIAVSVESKYDSKNIRFVLTRDTVKAAILPRMNVQIENKSYPTWVTYGETLPVPTPEHFTYSEGSTLTFEWYRADVDSWIFEDPVTGEWIEGFDVNSRVAIDGIPSDAGDYLLRVYASSTGGLIGTFTEIYVEIRQHEAPKLVFNFDGFKHYTDTYYDYYIVPAGQTIPYEIVGLVEGDTAVVEIDTRSLYQSYLHAGFPTVPYHDENNFIDRPDVYQVDYTIYVRDALGNQVNYEVGYDSLDIMIVPDETATPAEDSYLTTDETKPINVTFGWEAITELIDGKAPVEYYLYICDANGNKLTTTDEYGFSDMSVGADTTCAYFGFPGAGTYTVTVKARNGGWATTERSVTFTIGIRNEKGELVNEIGNDSGYYTVTVTQNGKTKVARILVQRPISMTIKETEVNLNEGLPVLDPTRIIMEAGKVIRLDHKLISIQVSVSDYDGEIKAVGLVVHDMAGNDVSHHYRLIRGSNGEGVAHIFDNACDATCNVARCTYIRDAHHHGGTATCVSLAVCEACHTPYGKLNENNHVSNATQIVPNGENVETHLVIHSCCAKTKEVCEHTQGTAATCITLAVCADCGWKYGELNPSNHAHDTFTYQYVNDQHHLATYTCCGESFKQNHNGPGATCLAPDVCNQCHNSYGRKNPDNHAGKLKGTVDSENPGFHVAEYECCHVVEVSGHFGGTATCTDQAICEACSASYGELAPHNHTSNDVVHTVRAENASMHDVTHACCGMFIRKEYHSGGRATCHAAAICEHCGEEYGLETDPSNHASNEVRYKIDTTQDGLHIKVHACCGQEISREEHSGGEATCRRGALCQHCGAEYGAKKAHTFDNACDSVCNLCEKQVRALVFHEDSDGNHACDECGADMTTPSDTPAMQTVSAPVAAPVAAPAAAPAAVKQMTSLTTDENVTVPMQMSEVAISEATVQTLAVCTSNINQEGIVQRSTVAILPPPPLENPFGENDEDHVKIL